MCLKLFRDDCWVMGKVTGVDFPNLLHFGWLFYIFFKFHLDHWTLATQQSVLIDAFDNRINFWTIIWKGLDTVIVCSLCFILRWSSMHSRYMMPIEYAGITHVGIDNLNYVNIWIIFSARYLKTWFHSLHSTQKCKTIPVYCHSHTTETNNKTNL